MQHVTLRGVHEPSLLFRYHGRDLASRTYSGQRAISRVHLSHSQTIDRVLWSAIETAYAHAYKIRKWRPTQGTAAWHCCEHLY